MNDDLNELIVTVAAIGMAMGAILVACMYLILLERKLSAWMQDRVGPNRVGPFGLLQPLADGIKFLLKEEVIPDRADKTLFVLAPCLAILTAFMGFALVPFGPSENIPFGLRMIIAPQIDIGLVLIFAISSLSVYAIVLGGWASNNKYSAIGALRASAQVISYEIPLAMSVVGVILLHGTLNLEQIQSDQAAAGFFGWNFWYQPLAGLIFFTSALAETNRLPFDLPECEQELVGGFHTEYSSMKFAMFFLGEYTHIITVSFITVILFFGGWQFPWIATAASDYTGVWLVKVFVLLMKVFAIIVLIMMIRWTIPRFRFDQLMELCWKVFVPLTMANLVAVMTVKQFELSLWWLPVISLVLFVAAGLISVNSKRQEIRRRGQRFEYRPAVSLPTGGAELTSKTD